MAINPRNYSSPDVQNALAPGSQWLSQFPDEDSAKASLDSMERDYQAKQRGTFSASGMDRFGRQGLYGQHYMTDNAQDYRRENDFDPGPLLASIGMGAGPAASLLGAGFRAPGLFTLGRAITGLVGNRGTPTGPQRFSAPTVARTTDTGAPAVAPGGSVGGGGRPTGGSVKDPDYARKLVAYWGSQPGVNPSVKNDPNYWVGRMGTVADKDQYDQAYWESRFQQPEGAPEGSQNAPGGSQGASGASGGGNAYQLGSGLAGFGQSPRKAIAYDPSNPYDNLTSMLAQSFGPGSEFNRP